MNLLVIADPLESFTIHKDSTFAMMREAGRRGHTLAACQPADLSWRDGRVEARVRPLRMALEPTAGLWFAAEVPEVRRLADFQAVLMRKDPPFDQAYLHATYLLELAERDGARIFNRPRALRDFNEKLAIARFPQFTVPCLVSTGHAEIRDFLEVQRDIVVKPLDAMGGSGVFRLRPGDPNLSSILETLTALGRREVMAQRYIPEIADGDKRILLIDGEPVPWALARIPAPGESRGNLAAGGVGRAQPLSARDLEIATALAPSLKAEGLFLVGLDVIGDWLTEVNVTSPTCFREIQDQTGFDVAARFIDVLEATIGA